MNHEFDFFNIFYQGLFGLVPYHREHQERGKQHIDSSCSELQHKLYFTFLGGLAPL